MARKENDRRKNLADILAFWEAMTKDSELPPQVRLKASENIAKYQEEGEVEDLELIVRYK